MERIKQENYAAHLTLDFQTLNSHLNNFVYFRGKFQKNNQL